MALAERRRSTGNRRWSDRPLHFAAEPLTEVVGSAPSSCGEGGARATSSGQLLYFDFSWRRLLPRPPGIAPGANDDRLVRGEIWAQHGQPMHFVTLEFEDDSTEAEFADDATRRGKRWIEYGIAIGFLANLSLAVARFGISHSTCEPFKDDISNPQCKTYMDPLWTGLLYGLQYVQTRTDKEFVRRNMQLVNLCWSLLQATSTLAFAFYFAIDEETGQRPMPGGGGEELVINRGGMCSSVSSAVFFTWIAFRMRFFYFMIFTCYMLCGYCFLAPWNSDVVHFALICSGLLFLSYTFEGLQRRDFLQASMVWRESRRSLLLLRNILPGPIIDELQAAKGRHAIARSYDQATVLFADVVSFTTMSAQISPPVLVELLNQMFRRFDDLAERNSVEKIKTIGDCYMAAAGVPLPNPYHAKTMARFGLQMLAVVQSGVLRNPANGESIRVRVGIHSGPCVAGVIGHKKFAYDIWGDAVNTASRMESHGEPLRLHCSAETRELLGSDFNVEAREKMTVKGKGEMQTYFVVSEREEAHGKSFLLEATAYEGSESDCEPGL